MAHSRQCARPERDVLRALRLQEMKIVTYYEDIMKQALK